jgi:hypothetical protein
MPNTGIEMKFKVKADSRVMKRVFLDKEGSPESVNHKNPAAVQPIE